MFSTLANANIGSAVRWVVTALGAILVAKGVGTTVDYSTIGAGLATALSLVWSVWANSKKVA